ncbi:MAG: RDD family protein [Bacillus sp. (in: firmicutes)]
MTDKKDIVQAGHTGDGAGTEIVPDRISATEKQSEDIAEKTSADWSVDLNEEEEPNSSLAGIKKEPEKEIPFAGFWLRFWAYLIDLLIVWSIGGIVFRPILKAFGLADDTSFFSPLTIGAAVIFYGYFVLMTKFLRQTLGKMILGIEVISLKEEKLSWGTVLFRELVGRYISKTISIAYLLVGILPKKQGLHDIFADTSVVVTNRM